MKKIEAPNLMSFKNKNLAKTWKKTLKIFIRPAFGECSTQTYLKPKTQPGRMPNLAQLRQLSYAGPEGQLRISWTE